MNKAVCCSSHPLPSPHDAAAAAVAAWPHVQHLAALQLLLPLKKTAGKGADGCFSHGQALAWVRGGQGQQQVGVRGERQLMQWP
jgi:hypothetical protein